MIWSAPFPFIIRWGKKRNILQLVFSNLLRMFGLAIDKCQVIAIKGFNQGGQRRYREYRRFFSPS